MTANTPASAFPSARQHMTVSTTLKKVWIGWVVSGLSVLFFLMDGIMKLIKPVPVVQATVQLGYPESCIVGLGVILLTCTVLYVFPRTAVLGSVLLTGYLGGAVATHVRVGASWFNTLFPVIFGCLVWGGLYLRDQRLKALLKA